MSRKDGILRSRWWFVWTVLMCLLILAADAATTAGAQGFRYVDHDPARQCGGNLPCHETIQGAVDAASAGDTIYVYPGEYVESVDLSRMEPDGALSIIAVDGTGTPAAGMVTVAPQGAGTALYSSSPFDGDVTIAGFNIDPMYRGVNIEVAGAGSDDRDVEIRNCTVQPTQFGSFHVIADGNVSIADCAGGGHVHGVLVERAGGDVEVTGWSSNGHVDFGIGVWGVRGDVLISKSTVYNAFAGIYVRSVSGKTTISRCTTEVTEAIGIDSEDLTGGLEVQGCVVRTSLGLNGIFFDDTLGTTGEVHGNIICENDPNGLEIDWPSPTVVNAEGNWCGCAGGPGDEQCDSVDEGNGAVDFTPWIDTISADAGGNSVVAGEPMVVRVRFSDAGGSVFLGPGPGDPRGPAPFTVSTDNGSLNGEGSTTGAFIDGSQGTFEVTLVPERSGTATLTVVGPCGLEREITLEGPLEEEEFVPEPGTVLLLGSGLMGLAGYAGLRLRKK